MSKFSLSLSLRENGGKWQKQKWGIFLYSVSSCKDAADLLRNPKLFTDNRGTSWFISITISSSCSTVCFTFHKVVETASRLSASRTDYVADASRCSTWAALSQSPGWRRVWWVCVCGPGQLYVQSTQRHHAELCQERYLLFLHGQTQRMFPCFSCLFSLSLSIKFNVNI